MVILGPNSAGKTTLLRCLTGIYKDIEGDVDVYGNNLKTKINDIKKMIGYCNQTDILFDYMTAYEHLYIYSKLKVLYRVTIGPIR